MQQYTGSLDWTAVGGAAFGACGDGGYTAIDFTTPTTVYADGAQSGCLVKSTMSGDPGTFLRTVKRH